ncbi:MAG: substrate-binding domain-containing protein [Planctomycetia bacterium]|nr:substrate-binding domain-containing protein [Planctomycetia bacterium]
MAALQRWTFVLGVLVVVFGGCDSGKNAVDQGGSPSTGGERVRGTVGVSLLTLTNPFFKEISDAMSAEAAKHGYELIVVSGEMDPARQQNQVKDFLVKGVSAIVLTPCDSKSIGPVIQEANRAGIPVFTADIACMAPEAKVVAHVASDNYGGGLEAATAMIEALGGRGKVAIIDHPIVESAMMRTKAFETRIAEENKKPEIDIEIVGKWPGYGDRETSFRVAQDVLQAHPDLNGIFAVNDPSALGVVAALENAGKAGKVKVVGFDGQPEAKQAIKQGKIYASPVQSPGTIGTETMRLIVKYFEGEDVPAEKLIPTRLYRREDAMADPALP